MITFYPKALYYCSTNDIVNRVLYENVKMKVDTTIISDYIKHFFVGDLNNCSDKAISDNLRSLKSTKELQLPGDNNEDHKNFSFFNIIVANGLDSEENLNSLLNEIYAKSNFDEAGNINTYILIYDKYLNVKDLQTSIPRGNLGVIYLDNKFWEGGLEVDENEFLNVIINTILSILLIPTRSQVTSELFSEDISSVLSVNSESLQFPDESTTKYIEYRYLQSLYKHFSKDDVVSNPFSYERLGIKETQKSKIEKLKENFFLERIKIPFWYSGKERNKYIKSRIKHYNDERESFLQRMLTDISKKKIDGYNHPSDIKSKIHMTIRETLAHSFALKSLLKGLNEFENIINDEQKKELTWKFVQLPLKEINISGVPFIKPVLYIWGILLFLSAIVGLIPMNFELRILPTIVFLIYSTICLIIGKIYVNNKSQQLQRDINQDKYELNEFITENSFNFILSARKYLNRNLQQLIHQVKQLLKRTLNNYDKHIHQREFDDLNKKFLEKYSKDILDKIDKIIDSSTFELLKDVLKKNKHEIVSNIENIDIFIYHALHEFYRSDSCKNVAEILYDEKYVENKFPDLTKLPVSDNIKGKTKNIFIVPDSSKRKDYKSLFNNQDLIIINTPVENIWCYLNIGAINKKL